MQIFVKTPEGNSIALDVEPETTVNQMKGMLEYEGYEFNDIGLVNGGVNIDGQTSISDLGMQDNGVVDLHTGLKGKFSSSIWFENYIIMLSTNILGGKGFMDLAILELARKYIINKKVCRTCYAKNHLKARVCRKRKCGHNPDLRPKKIQKTA